LNEAFNHGLLAHHHLSAYAIRQLARNAGAPPHLSRQGKAFDLAVDQMKAVSERGITTLLADLTNVLRNGDLIVCTDPDLPTILECKLSKVKDVRFERQGRRGRQLARLESIGSFLRTGRGTIWGEAVERMTVETVSVPRFNYREVAEVIGSALQHKPLTLLVSEHELFSAALAGEMADTAPLQGWGRNLLVPVVVGSSVDRVSNPWPDVPPPILWDLPAEQRWALMEGDLSVTHAVSADAFLGFAMEAGRVVRLVDATGVVPHGYEVQVAGDVLTIGPKFLIDVVYNHEAIPSAAARLVESAVKASALLKGAV
jgi:hypothetical protein